MAARGWSYALPGLIVFAVVDQGAYGLSFIRHPYPPAEVGRILEGHAMPPEALPYRIESDNSFFTMQGFHLGGGYISFRPERQLDAVNVKRLQIAGVGWVQTRTPWAKTDSLPKLDAALTQDTRFTYDALGGRSSWARVPEPMPRARLVTKEFVSSAPSKDIE